jgi:hypothetical protein
MIKRRELLSQLSHLELQKRIWELEWANGLALTSSLWYDLDPTDPTVMKISRNLSLPTRLDQRIESIREHLRMKRNGVWLRCLLVLWLLVEASLFTTGGMLAGSYSAVGFLEAGYSCIVPGVLLLLGAWSHIAYTKEFNDQAPAID